MSSSIFICPVCSSPLETAAKTYRCVNNHTYDTAKEGYVNLILANQKHSREPGDSKEMMEARKSFLNKGYYKPLARSAASLIIK
jgi:23S rRNA (guanine745-N1)-methyltransferase